MSFCGRSSARHEKPMLRHLVVCPNSTHGHLNCSTVSIGTRSKLCFENACTLLVLLLNSPSVLLHKHCHVSLQPDCLQNFVSLFFPILCLLEPDHEFSPAALLQYPSLGFALAMLAAYLLAAVVRLAGLRHSPVFALCQLFLHTQHFHTDNINDPTKLIFASLQVLKVFLQRSRHLIVRTIRGSVFLMFSRCVPTRLCSASSWLARGLQPAFVHDLRHLSSVLWIVNHSHMFCTLSQYNPGKHPCFYSESRLPSADHLPFPKKLCCLSCHPFPPFFRKLRMSTPFPKDSTLGHGVNSEPSPDILHLFVHLRVFALSTFSFFPSVHPHGFCQTRIVASNHHEKKKLAHPEVEPSVRHRSLGHRNPSRQKAPRALMQVRRVVRRAVVPPGDWFRVECFGQAHAQRRLCT